MTPRSRTTQGVGAPETRAEGAATAGPKPRAPITVCPICRGAMEQVYESGHLKVCVCIDCFSGIYIPVAAWDVARKRPLTSA